MNERLCLITITHLSVEVGSRVFDCWSHLCVSLSMCVCMCFFSVGSVDCILLEQLRVYVFPLLLILSLIIFDSWIWTTKITTKGNNNNSRNSSSSERGNSIWYFDFFLRFVTAIKCLSLMLRVFVLFAQRVFSPRNFVSLLTFNFRMCSLLFFVIVVVVACF